eukprot:m.85746 g.85746  ORF g.85746 m.85746 type:complete len:134 (+) comp36465_c0_seq4:700-1101(+)
MDWRNPGSPEVPLSCYNGSCFASKVEVLESSGQLQGLRVSTLGGIPAGGAELVKVAREVDVEFGRTCQEVTRMLGSPSKVYYKDDDRMTIHSPSPCKLRQSQHSDYLFNYFTLGVVCALMSQAGRKHRMSFSV